MISPSSGSGSDKATCQEHCFPTPQTELYKCDTSNPTTFTCKKCAKDEQGCMDQKMACDSCKAPAPVSDKFKCNNATGQVLRW
jgi:hypothetical protein